MVFLHRVFSLELNSLFVLNKVLKLKTTRIVSFHTQAFHEHLSSQTMQQFGTQYGAPAVEIVVDNISPQLFQQMVNLIRMSSSMVI